MRFAIASAAVIGAASASYGYGYPPQVNSTTEVTPPTYETSPPAYEVPSSSAGYEPYPSETPIYETTVVSELTTICPEPTEVTYGGQTYTVSTSTTLTISKGPITVTYPVKTPGEPLPTGALPPPVEYPSAPAPPASGIPPPAPYPSANGTVEYPAGPTATGPAGTAPPPEFEGAATKMGAGLMAIVAAAVAFL